ncbi:MAG TPA: sigma-70 family RNA polymerase sigma factor [Gaiellaceae bacterium]|nr:sigma-70 family RNA polymerase sigma factor [Gaiellaceae bacterium]
MFRVDPLANPEPLIKRVYAYVAYRVGDGPDAEDLTSETFERALRYRKSYDSSKGEPIAWLIGIARRCVEGRPPPLEHAAEQVDAPDHRDLEDDALRRITLSGAVGRLEERDRELIALRYGADLTARQIAELQGAKTNAIEVALHRALGRLRTQLEGESEPPVRKSEAGR